MARLHELVDALAASLVDEEVVGALAALAGVDPLSVPQPLGLDFLSGIDVSYLLARNSLTRVREAGTSRRANRCRATAACFASAASGERRPFPTARSCPQSTSEWAVGSASTSAHR
ncbi:hypothetical protein ACFYSF_45820 [Streptomyces canus]|uniref:hypothetical protein n=1 Tax=Streptomyces canus TaxID=58343 RepID=UPI0036C5E1B9